MIRIRVIDLETTGEPPDAAVCEAAWCDLVFPDEGPRHIVGPVSTFVAPGRPMPPDARGIHHISDTMLAGAPVFPSVLKQIIGEVSAAFCAHRADFERAFLTDPLFEGVRWIDTYKVAARIWPDAPDLKNQTLRYYLGLDEKSEGFSERAMPPHRAGPDCFVTAHILNAALDLASFEEMLAWTVEPALMRTCPLRKHRGAPWAEVPSDYLGWIVNGANEVDEDVKWNARQELARRLAERRAAHVEWARLDVPAISTIEGLEHWWRTNATLRKDLGIVGDSPQLAEIIEICRTRRAAIVAAAAPQTSETT